MLQNLRTNSNTLRDYLKTNNLRIHRSKGDGHCLLYSLVKSLKDQLNRNVDLYTVKSSILAEISQNAERYSHFLTDDRDHIQDIKNYIYHRNYNTPICDLLPSIVANSLQINIQILDQLDIDHSFNVLHINSLSNSTSTLTLHRI